MFIKVKRFILPHSGYQSTVNKRPSFRNGLDSEDGGITWSEIKALVCVSSGLSLTSYKVISI